MTPAQRVAAGAEMLDIVHPGWASKIDLSSLDMGSLCLCILGQIYEEFEWGVRIVCNYSEQRARDLGFNVNGDHGDFSSVYKDFAALQICWVAEIRARLDAPVVVWRHSEREVPV